MNDHLCEYESREPGTLLCVLPMGHSDEHVTPRYGPICRECGTPLTLDLSIRNGFCDDHAPGGVM